MPKTDIVIKLTGSETVDGLVDTVEAKLNQQYGFLAVAFRQQLMWVHGDDEKIDLIRQFVTLE
ncbi:hypothetical protein [Lacticaseibacillus pantheris]|jgi:hypothetical protein|uniref:Uncharacterized protein n=1 Tax=Lacticaseibacillus pantheris DSM 15945 = JCM 12539 = NBRC 106106 TaxID=1423783 RepID=A0A0R1U0X3_9LACO|nr:hypothetical protein [Lacticaseibacillus pantheris]KRL86973.1 hypothetical protein FC50_GL000173 [Lacticaseibacillus pantheris DSM 15945 = JCM 12539 = NBRC 106106]WKF84574.1 hypothetical protein QY874_09820 [Lacticaseibacillus pantheris]